MFGSQIFQNEEKTQGLKNYTEAETWYISRGKGSHVTNRICPQQFLWHALKTSPNKFCRWSNVGSSHSHVFFWHRGTRIICKNLATFRNIPNPTEPEIALILFQGTSPTSWETYGQNDPSQKILPIFANHFQIYWPADAGRQRVPTSFFVPKVRQSSRQSPYSRTRFPRH